MLGQRSVCLAFAAGLLLAASSVAAAPSIIVGGWSPANTTDPSVIAAAQAAVGLINAQYNTNYVYSGVSSAQQQVVAGVKYNLTIMVSEPPAEVLFPIQAVIVSQPWLTPNYTLVSYNNKPVPVAVGAEGSSQPPTLAGGWTPVNTTDPAVEAAGQNAVNLVNEQYNTSYIYQYVISGEQQVVSGIKYNLIISVQVFPPGCNPPNPCPLAGTGSIQTVVVDQPWMTPEYTLVSYQPVSMPTTQPTTQGSTETSTTITGGWTPVNTTDPAVVAAAENATILVNEQYNTNYLYQYVISGEQQVVAGMKYNLIISVQMLAPGCKPPNPCPFVTGAINVVVVDQPWMTPEYTLLSYGAVPSPSTEDSTAPAPITEPAKPATKPAKPANVALPGGVSVANTSDPEVISAAEAAVQLFDDSTPASLQYVSVLKAAEQVVAGIKYFLVISVTSGNAPGKLVAQVLSQPWNTEAPYTLLSATYAPSVVGGTTPASPTSPDVVDAAEEAISLINDLQPANGATLTYGKVISAQTQVVSGTKYYLTIAASQTSSSGVVSPALVNAQVLYQPWQAQQYSLLDYKVTPLTRQSPNPKTTKKPAQSPGGRRLISNFVP